ncbi:hypothetical protein GRO01_17360 [Gluconobacter roseus NBRC 3990]|uniref:Uncharacterized protein n=1 Tax=Gluconobacter roseus NBRC 3990 TaxID=1307950 RepID=A0A4Y3M4J0_9PROT|nr:hypothetical protein AA3990_2471 [Gluconobacter roseus NBRC 3990]GEB04160.1 hypothetical protein GRO01_17360 [Gluconobacter roseus NBRC 3990]GLP92604.1 hypothetical protein GCM10007871_05820 [Gluconobacter roseus NBRC 3990]
MDVRQERDRTGILSGVGSKVVNKQRNRMSSAVLRYAGHIGFVNGDVGRRGIKTKIVLWFRSEWPRNCKLNKRELFGSFLFGEQSDQIRQMADFA